MRHNVEEGERDTKELWKETEVEEGKAGNQGKNGIKILKIPSILGDGTEKNNEEKRYLAKIKFRNTKLRNTSLFLKSKILCLVRGVKEAF